MIGRQMWTPKTAEGFHAIRLVYVVPIASSQDFKTLPAHTSEQVSMSQHGTPLEYRGDGGTRQLSSRILAKIVSRNPQGGPPAGQIAQSRRCARAPDPSKGLSCIHRCRTH